MRELASALLATVALTTSGCIPPDPDDAGSDEAEARAAAAPDRGAIPRGTIKIVDPDLLRVDESPSASTGVVQAAAGTILFMNRQGGTYTPGNNDSRSNRSSIVDQTRSIGPWNLGDAAWTQVMTCVRAQFAPFDIDVTDVDPGAAIPHYESVVSGSPQDVGMPDGVGGVSPFTSDCGIIPNSIVFTFAEVLPQDPQIICEVVAQEVSHSFGLDHEYLCADPMTYLADCGAKTFQNVSSPCGEYSARSSCAISGQFDCGTATQNSYAMLSERLGLRDGSPVPPTLAILRPLDGDVVGPGFPVQADATDDTGVTEVEMRIDGTTVATATTAPFEFTAPADLAFGTHVVEVIARDGTAETSQSISVELQEGGGDGSGGDGTGAGGGGGTDTDGDGVPDDPATAGNQTITGGCAAGGGGSSGLAGLLLGLGIVLLRRRRA